MRAAPRASKVDSPGCGADKICPASEGILEWRSVMEEDDTDRRSGKEKIDGITKEEVYSALFRQEYVREGKCRGGR